MHSQFKMEAGLMKIISFNRSWIDDSYYGHWAQPFYPIDTVGCVPMSGVANLFWPTGHYSCWQARGGPQVFVLAASKEI